MPTDIVTLQVIRAIPGNNKHNPLRQKLLLIDIHFSRMDIKIRLFEILDILAGNNAMATED